MYGNDARVRYVYQANRGVAAARNHVLRFAQGEFVALLGSDDAWKPWKLEVQMAVMVYLSQVGLVWTDMEAVDKDVVVWDQNHPRKKCRGGKPPISPLPEARGYARVVRFGANADEFVEALDLAVKNASEEFVRMWLESVKEETWAARVDLISQHVKTLGSGPAMHVRR
jgi:glycosyltransferase involved in cell wall biosynthesis